MNRQRTLKLLVDKLERKAPEGLVESRDAQGQETVKFRKDVALRLRNDNSGLRGPEIEIKTVDGLLAGTYTFDLTRDGFRVRFPAPTTLLRQVTWGRKTNQRQLPPVGSGQARRGFEQAPRGFKQASQGFVEAPVGFGQVPPGIRQAPPGFEQSSSGFEQSSKDFPPSARGFGRSQQGYEPARANQGRFYGSASAGNVPSRPVPVQRLPTSTTPRRAPVPNNKFSQNDYRQPQRGYNQAQGGFQQPQWQQQGPNKNRREKASSGCCSGGGDSSPGPTSTYERLGMSEEQRKKSQKERKKREKEERKRAEKMIKKQKKSKQGGYGGSDSMYPEKSGFYDDKRGKSNWCCC